MLALAASLWAAQAFGAEGAVAKGPSEAVFVAQIVALLVAGRLLGEAMLRIGQPAVVGQLIAGIILGPSVFGLLAPGAHALVFPTDHAQKAMIDGVAQLGVLLLLLLTGIETDVALVRRIGRPAASVSLSGIAVPFGLGVLVGMTLLPQSLVPHPEQRLVTALFLGTALSISSIKIVAMVVDEMNFMRRNLGQIIVASAIIDDTIGWIIIAVTFGLARPQGLDAGHLALSLGGTLLFLALSFTVGRRLVAAIMRFANDRFVSELAVVTAILVVMGLMALITDGLGVHTVLGAFVAGVLCGQSPILTRRVEQELRGLVIAFFAPIFFGIAGLSTDLSILKNPAIAGLTAALILVASLGKFGGAFLGGKLGGLDRNQSLALALGMNARGSTEVIVATIGLSIGAISPDLFTMIVTMAVVTTTAMPPTLRWALRRLPLDKAEAERLDREAFEESGFVGNIERILLARDQGASGRLAARLCGLLVGSRDLPVTVMALGDAGSGTTEPVADVAAAAEGPHRAEGAEPAPPQADVTAKPVEQGAEQQSVADETRKGYGLLVVGVEPATRPEGGLHPRLAGLIQGVETARAIVVARGGLKRDPAEAPLKLLVPTTGTAPGRRAAEVAFALAKAQGAEVTVLLVTEPPDDRRRRTPRRPWRDRPPEQAEILDDMREVAKQFGVSITAESRAADDKTAAILGVARRGGDTLIVLGVEPRPSEARPFGALADSLLESAEHSLLLVVGAGRIAADKRDKSGQDAQHRQQSLEPGAVQPRDQEAERSPA